MFLGLEPIHIVMIIVAIIALVSAWGTFFFKPKVPVNTEMQTINKSLKDLSDENARLKETYKCEFEDVNKKYLIGKTRIDELEDKLNQMSITVERLANFEKKYNLLLEWGRKVLHIGDVNDLELPKLDYEIYYDMKNYKKWD